jgi:hypothetical protein
MSAQLDVFRDSPQAQAAAYREAALTARVDPYWTEEQREARARYYQEQAERIENGGMSAPITGHENARWQAGGKGERQQ